MLVLGFQSGLVVVVFHLPSHTALMMKEEVLKDAGVKMIKRNSMQYRHFEKESRRSRRLKTVSYIFLGLLGTATAAVVSFALTR